MKELTLSLILPTLNRPQMVRECLETVAKQTFKAKELIVIDQSEDQQTKQVIDDMDLGPVTKRYFHQKEKSLIKARHNGLSKVEGSDLVFFVEDDSTLSPNFFEDLVRHFQEDTLQVYAGGMGTNVNATFKSDWLANLFMLPRSGEGKFQPNGIPTFPYWKKEYCDVEFLSGGNSMFRTEIIKKYRYDERLCGFGYCDDMDVTYRISRKYKLFYEPKATYVHEEHNNGKNRGIIYRKALIQNIFYLTRKNKGITLKSGPLFMWYVLGQILDDLRGFRKGALVGNFWALWNILRGKLDSISDVKTVSDAHS